MPTAGELIVGAGAVWCVSRVGGAAELLPSWGAACCAPTRNSSLRELRLLLGHAVQGAEAED
jgi:hypothetical protein